MKTMIYCTKKNNQNNFYMNYEGEDYYLFTQAYHKSANEFYKNGVSLDKAWDYKKSRKNPVLIKTMDKLKPYIKYVEREFSISVLECTRKRNAYGKVA